MTHLDTDQAQSCLTSEIGRIPTMEIGNSGELRSPTYTIVLDREAVTKGKRRTWLDFLTEDNGDMMDETISDP